MNDMIKTERDRVAKMAADAGDVNLLDVLATSLGLDPIRIPRHERADLRAGAILEEAQKRGLMSKASWSYAWTMAVQDLQAAARKRG